MRRANHRLSGRLDSRPPVGDILRSAVTLGRAALLPAALLAGAALAQAAGSAFAVAAGIGLFIAGLPHGAFASNGRFLIAERGYILRYLIAGIGVGTAFIVMPVAMLGVFLALSAWHFAREPAGGRWTRRAAIAGLAIGGSALLRPGDTGQVFAALCGSPVPPTMMIALALAGAAGCALAAAALARRPGDAALWAMAASPALFHPVLATGLIFMLGHAGPATAAIMRRSGRSWWLWPALAGSSALLAAAASVFDPPADLLPLFAAGALAVVMPHLLPHAWFAKRSPSGSARPPAHKTQAATSPAT